MPTQDGSLTDADRVALACAVAHMIPASDAGVAVGAPGFFDDVEKRARRRKSTRSAFLRVAEALSLDLMSHAVGGFSAMTEQEQIGALLSIENALPAEFSLLLGIVRDVYYEDDRTPERPLDFDGDAEIFGKVQNEA